MREDFLLHPAHERARSTRDHSPVVYRCNTRSSTWTILRVANSTYLAALLQTSQSLTPPGSDSRFGSALDLPEVRSRRSADCGYLILEEMDRTRPAGPAFLPSKATRG